MHRLQVLEIPANVSSLNSGDSFVLEVLGVGGRIPHAAPALWSTAAPVPERAVPPVAVRRGAGPFGSALALGVRRADLGAVACHTAAMSSAGAVLGVARCRLPSALSDLQQGMSWAR